MSEADRLGVLLPGAWHRRVASDAGDGVPGIEADSELGRGLNEVFAQVSKRGDVVIYFSADPEAPMPAIVLTYVPTAQGGEAAFDALEFEQLPRAVGESTQIPFGFEQVAGRADRHIFREAVSEEGQAGSGLASMRYWLIEREPPRQACIQVWGHHEDFSAGLLGVCDEIALAAYWYTSVSDLPDLDG